MTDTTFVAGARMSAWVEGRYGVDRRTLDGGITLSVSRRLTPAINPNLPYEAFFDGRRLKNRFATIEEAKAGTEAVARHMLSKALNDLLVVADD